MSGELRDAFSGKRVMVTGHTGFKGSWLTAWLVKLGSDVYGFSLPACSENVHFLELSLADQIHHLEGDVRSWDQVEEAFSRARPEIVLHLAAQSLVSKSYLEPKGTFDTNVGGFVNVLEAIRRSSTVKSAVMVTSDKCYLNQEWVWGYRENDRLGGRDAYSASKAAAELVFEAYLESFLRGRSDLGVATVRAGNVIGGGDWSEDRIIPDCVRAFSRGNDVVLRKPYSTRPWQHVLDPLHGYLTLSARLLENPELFSSSWNFGPSGQEVRTVHEVALAVAKEWGNGGVSISDLAGELPHEAGLLHLNCDKAHSSLGWWPRWDFDTTVRETVRWYKSFIQDSRVITVDQLDAFESPIG